MYDKIHQLPAIKPSIVNVAHKCLHDTGVFLGALDKFAACRFIPPAKSPCGKTFLSSHFFSKMLQWALHDKNNK